MRTPRIENKVEKQLREQSAAGQGSSFAGRTGQWGKLVRELGRHSKSILRSIKEQQYHDRGWVSHSREAPWKVYFKSETFCVSKRMRLANFKFHWPTETGRVA